MNSLGQMLLKVLTIIRALVRCIFFVSLLFSFNKFSPPPADAVDVVFHVQGVCMLHHIR